MGREAFSAHSGIDVRITNHIEEALRDTCSSTPALADAVRGLVRSDTEMPNPFRLIAQPTLGCLSGEPEDALPVCALSRVWWAGAETLDDLMDGHFNGPAAGMSHSTAMVAATACLTLLPQAIIRTQGYPAPLAVAMTSELVGTSLQCAAGQLDDIDTARPVTWKQVMCNYAGKTGAPYARDAALVAHVAGLPADGIRAWRVFGSLFGVLRQLANDRAYGSATEDADLANGTPTLVLAHAVETLPTPAAVELLDLHRSSRVDAAARTEIWHRLRARPVATGYNQRLAVMRARMLDLLRSLASPSDHRTLIERLIIMSAQKAML
ncbi:class 1 isoprenoid biosynthesis enzyme [Streptomyces sp. NPDC004658]|uniref:class 1 isoprenoid biosynthesis enzyme n=1 Tax=Streptomyces sp. NPDC004658 TaxID=3154672 RepID=UPI0033A1676A